MQFNLHFSPETAPPPHPQSCQEAPSIFFFLNKTISDLFNLSSFTNIKVTSYISLELILTIWFFKDSGDWKRKNDLVYCVVLKEDA